MSSFSEPLKCIKYFIKKILYKKLFSMINIDLNQKKNQNT